MAPDPYATLGISRSATDAEIRAAYRHAVQRTHPDHNNGSEESERAFEDVQDAYARIRAERAAGPRSGTGARSRTRSTASPPPPPTDAATEQRLADLERQLREARERAARAAAEAAQQARERVKRPDRPSDEELGYVETDDSLSRIISDARDELRDRWGEVKDSDEAKRVADQAADLVDELGAMLRGERRGKDSD